MGKAVLPKSEELCDGCYRAVGGALACYRRYWAEPCPCVRCAPAAVLVPTAVEKANVRG